MALACLAAEAEPAGEKLARQGFALLDGSDVELAAVQAAFDRLQPGVEAPADVPPDDPLVETLLEQPPVRTLVAEVLGSGVRVLRAGAIDQKIQRPLSWQQPSRVAERMLSLRWHLDLIGPADGALRVLPGSHRNGHLSLEEIATLALATPAIELPVSAGTVLVLDPLLVQGSRRRATQGHRRILQVELAAGDPPPPLEWAWV